MAYTWQAGESVTSAKLNLAFAGAQPLNAKLTAFGALANAVGFLKNDGAGNLTWAAAGGGSGDFVGPGSSTDNAVVRFDGTTGKLGQNSTTIIADNGRVSIVDSTTAADASPLTLSSNTGAGKANQLVLNNTTGAASFKSQVSFLSNGVFKWAIGNDTTGAGLNDFWVYDDSVGDFRVTISDDVTLKPRTSHSVVAFSPATSGAVTPFIVRSNPGTGINTIGIDTQSSSNRKNQISLLHNNSLEWAIGNDSPGNGTDDFFIYQNSATDFRFQILSSGLWRGKAYTTAGLLSNDTSGNVTTATAGTSLSLSAGTLNTIQDIRTTATPTFGGSITLGGAAATGQKFFYSQNTSGDNQLGVFPSGIGFLGTNTATDLQMYTSGADRFDITAAGNLRLAASSTIPASNPSGGFYIYVDPADNKLKARGVSGTITVLALP